MAIVYIALVHYPVYNKNRDVITSALTTIDLHDFARLAATYGLGGFYLVTPLDDQKALADEMIAHWRHGWGFEYNANRAEALALVRTARTLRDASEEIEKNSGIVPSIIGTSAAEGPRGSGRTWPQLVKYEELRSRLDNDGPVLLVFGTAWGLTDEALVECDLILESIKGPTEYNHLSVRAAAGIIVDRLLGWR